MSRKFPLSLHPQVLTAVVPQATHFVLLFIVYNVVVDETTR